MKQYICNKDFIKFFLTFLCVNLICLIAHNINPLTGTISTNPLGLITLLIYIITVCFNLFLIAVSVGSVINKLGDYFYNKCINN